MTHLTIIVATELAGGIGMHNTMPWHLPEDLAHFKRLTSGHPIIMGRKTFDSIGRPLPNRRNIVVTRNREWRHEGVEAVASLEAAIALAGSAPAFVIGGAQIYQQAIALAERIVRTEIAHAYPCDAFFPAPDPALWQESARLSHHSERAGLDYAFVTLERRRAPI